MFRSKPQSNVAPSPRPRPISGSFLEVIAGARAEAGRHTLTAKSGQRSFVVLIDGGTLCNVSGTGLDGRDALRAAAILTDGEYLVEPGWPMDRPVYQVGLDAALSELLGGTVLPAPDLPQPRGVDTLRQRQDAAPAVQASSPPPPVVPASPEPVPDAFRRAAAATAVLDDRYAPEATRVAAPAMEPAPPPVSTEPRPWPDSLLGTPPTLVSSPIPLPPPPSAPSSAPPRRSLMAAAPAPTAPVAAAAAPAVVAPVADVVPSPPVAAPRPTPPAATVAITPPVIFERPVAAEPEPEPKGLFPGEMDASRKQGGFKHRLTQVLLWLVQMDEEPERYTLEQAWAMTRQSLRSGLYEASAPLRALFHRQVVKRWDGVKADWEKSGEQVRRKQKPQRRSSSDHPSDDFLGLK